MKTHTESSILLPKLGVGLLRKIQKHILEEPRRLAMGIVDREGVPGTAIHIEPNSYNGYNPHETHEFPQCGTVCCILGWARRFDKHVDGKIKNFHKLVEVDIWPTKFKNKYARAKTPEARAKIASNRIEHFIATKGAE